MRYSFTSKLKRKIILCLVVSVFFIKAMAQSEVKQIYTYGNIDSLSLQEYMQLVDRYIGKHEDSFWITMQKIKTQSLQQKYLQGIMYYNYKMAKYYIDFSPNLDSAIFFALNNIKLSDSFRVFNNQIFVSYNNIGNAYGKKKEYAKALYYLIKSYNNANAFSTVYTYRDSIVMLNNILVIWLKIGSNHETQTYLNQLVQLVNTYGDSSAWVRGMGNYAIAAQYAVINNDSLLYYYNESLTALLAEDQKPRYFFPLLNGITKHYLSKGLADTAWKYIELFEKYNKEINPKQETYLHFLEAKAHYHFLKKNYKSAIDIIQALYDTCKSLDYSDFILHILPLMIDIYDGAGQFNKAYKYAREYGDLGHELNRTQLNTMYESQYQYQLKLLKDDLEEKDMHILLQQKTLQQRTIIIFITVLSLLILGSLVYLLKRNLKLKEKVRKEELEKMNTQHELEKLASRITGIEEERKRLAIDLHDGVANELWALQLQLNHFTDKITQNTYDKTLLQQYQTHLSNVIEEVRNTAKNLRPGLLTQNGLESAVWQLCHRINTHQQKVNVTCNIYETIPRFNKNTELSVYRIIQELTQNALKHAANATAIDIQIIYKNQNLNVTIEDNGKGMPADATSLNKNNGLANIYDRVKLLNGEISCLSYPNVGTCFIINIPNIS